MTETKISEAVAAIRAALGASAGLSKTGAQLNKIVKEVAPDLNIREVTGILTGPGAFTKFLNTYLGDLVTQVGNQGNDILFSIGGMPMAPEVSVDPGLWKSFVSPSAQVLLFLRLGDAKLYTSRSSEGTTSDFLIEKVTQDEHDAIRRGFLESLPVEQRVLIEEDLGNDQSYDSFVRALRARNQNKAWGKHRRDEFQRILNERLKSSPIDSGLYPAVLAQLSESQEAVRKADDGKAPISTVPASRLSGEHSSAHYDGRQASPRLLAKAVLDVMTEDELRRLWLPFGAILDALGRGAKQ